MQGIGIHDLTDGGLSFDLRELLAELGHRGQNAWWRARTRVWYIAESVVPALDTEEPPGNWVRGSDLMNAPGLTQVVDGVIEGVDDATMPQSEVTPWVVLRAVDSSWWEVYTDDIDVLAAMRKRFADIRPARYTSSDPATEY